jgi:hypothetical protein
MKVARDWDQLTKTQPVALLGFREALELLASPAETAEPEESPQDTGCDPWSLSLLYHRRGIELLYEVLRDPASTLSTILEVHRIAHEDAMFWAERKLRAERELGKLLGESQPPAG